MTTHRLKKLIESKQREADKHNKLVYLDAIKGKCINGYDLIKSEYMEGKYGTLTENQLGMILEKCQIVGRGGVCIR